MAKVPKKNNLSLIRAPPKTAEFISDERVLRQARSVIEPSIRVQSGIAKIFINTTMEGVAPAAGDEVHLHVRDAVTSVHIQLVSLDGHFFHVLDAGLNERLGRSSKLHALRGADDAIDIVSGGHVGQAIPSAARVSHDELGHGRDISADER